MSMAHVLLPLYVYPDNNIWSNAVKNIELNPGQNFSVVINPASGPGAKNSFPDSNYISNITKLNSYSNVQILGYVDASFATCPTAQVVEQVTTYHNWTRYLQNHPGMDIHVDGIFFDDCYSVYNSTIYKYYQTITSKAKSIMGTGFQHVLFNTGVTPDSRAFGLADEVIVFEDYYHNYNDDVPFNTPTQYWNQSTLLIHHFNDTGDRQQQIIDNLVGNNFQGLYISTTGDYNNTQVKPYIVSNTGYPNGPHPDSTTNIVRDEVNSGIYEYLSDLWARFCSDMY